MAEVAKQLLLTQGQLQRSIVRAVDNLKKLGRANVTSATLRSRITSLKENWALFFRGHSELLNSITDETKLSISYFKDNIYDAVEDAYQSALDFMNESLETLEPPAVSLNQTGTDSSSGHARSNFSLSHLPPISLPPFDGNLDKWEQFRDRFNSLIIQNRDLTDFARMHYLLSCLTGCALECVRDLAVTADNFDSAWQALNSRFENKRRLIRTHLSTLLNLPVISRESAGDLQALLDKVTSSLTSLKNLNRRPKDLWSDILVHIICQRLDASSRKSWSIKTSDSDDLPSYTDLLEFLRHRRRALDDLVVPASRQIVAKPSPRKITASTASSNLAPVPAAAVSPVSAPANAHHVSSPAGPASRCPICQARHYFNSCPSFVKGSLSHRRSLVQTHKRCFNCLGGNHVSRDCPSKYTCRTCHQKHHSLLHDDASEGSHSSSTQERPADIAKMYRQILVDERDVDFQRILWQPDSRDDVCEYQLLTVTYGTACAPFLALRVLKQLAHDDGHEFPLARAVLNNHIYVDDVLFGADTVDHLVEKRDQLTTLLLRGGFTLRKWASNSARLLSDIDPVDHGLACSPIPVSDEQLKILGTHWMPFSDEFQFRISAPESVPHYSTPAFLNAFSRFCSRRGPPSHVYSDNGTTFVGADRELRSAYCAAIRDPSFLNLHATENISWHFIPPAAPHFGGMWEAEVKSVKHHLRRVIGSHALTFEEFSTLLCRIEACLNSRPLAPLADSCDSYDVLTPGHFLIGSALTVPPEESTLDCAENRLNRWQLIRHKTERLWSLWYMDYVNTLQQRSKWRRSQPALKAKQLVILKNSALPPFFLAQCRQDETFPDHILWSDEAIFTPNGIFNSKNFIMWQHQNPHAVCQCAFQFRWKLNVWVGVIDNRVIGPYYLPPRLDGERYAQFLENHLPILLEKLPLQMRQTMIFQHDGAPPHYSRRARMVLDRHFPDRWIGRNGPISWPARSPDLNVLDYFVWGYIKNRV
ncbi:uncharacterized protein [Cardiocondyla obscurior]|uniref:uncharacterized protein n=1 Tax=Cardiocondyla obscurior TaxID=286306 RepID=UPI0039657FF4